MSRLTWEGKKMLMKLTVKELSLDFSWTAQVTYSRCNGVKKVVELFEETGRGKKLIFSWSAFSDVRAMFFIFQLCSPSTFI